MAGPRPSVRAAAAVLAVAAAAAGVSQAFGRFTFSLLFTDVRDDLGLSNTSAGTLGSANLLAYLTGTLVVSLVVGRAGLGRTARTGVAGVTAGLLLLAWAPNAAVTAVALVITGLFAAGVWVTVPAIATAQVGAGRRGTAIGLVGAGIGVGIVVASMLHGTADADRWRQVYRVEAAVALVVTVAGLRLLRHGEGAGSRPGPGTGPGFGF